MHPSQMRYHQLNNTNPRPTNNKRLSRLRKSTLPTNQQKIHPRRGESKRRLLLFTLPRPSKLRTNHTIPQANKLLPKPTKPTNTIPPPRHLKHDRPNNRPVFLTKTTPHKLSFTHHAQQQHNVTNTLHLLRSRKEEGTNPSTQQPIRATRQQHVIHTLREPRPNLQQQDSATTVRYGSFQPNVVGGQPTTLHNRPPSRILV